MKKMFLVALAAMTVAMTGCSSVSDTVGQAVSEAVQEVAAQLVTGDVVGEIGTTYSTQWFEFNVESIEFVSEYAGYAAEEGNTLIDVVVTEKGTFDEPVPMGIFDFIVDHESFEEYAYPMEPLDDTMMPEEFDLAKDETVTYHMVFEVPEDTEGLFLFYTEIDESDTEGATFTININ